MLRRRTTEEAGSFEASYVLQQSSIIVACLYGLFLISFFHSGHAEVSHRTSAHYSTLQEEPVRKAMLEIVLFDTRLQSNPKRRRPQHRLLPHQ